MLEHSELPGSLHRTPKSYYNWFQLIIKARKWYKAIIWQHTVRIGSDRLCATNCCGSLLLAVQARRLNSNQFSQNSYIWLFHSIRLQIHNFHLSREERASKKVCLQLIKPNNNQCRNVALYWKLGGKVTNSHLFL